MSQVQIRVPLLLVSRVILKPNMTKSLGQLANVLNPDFKITFVVTDNRQAISATRYKCSFPRLKSPLDSQNQPFFSTPL